MFPHFFSTMFPWITRNYLHIVTKFQSLISRVRCKVKFSKMYFPTDWHRSNILSSHEFAVRYDIEARKINQWKSMNKNSCLSLLVEKQQFTRNYTLIDRQTTKILSVRTNWPLYFLVTLFHKHQNEKSESFFLALILFLFSLCYHWFTWC